MTKKGLSYVDWSISVGLFIVYLLVLFILLAPAFKSSGSSDYLNGILKNGLDENINLELKRFPLYVRTDGLSEAEAYFQIDNLPQEFEDYYDPGGGEDEVKKLGIFTKISQTEITEKGYYGDIILISENVRIILVDEGQSIGEVDIYLSSDKLFRVTEIITETTYAIFDGTVGVAETITGIHEDSFEDFFYNDLGEPEDYEFIKSELNYPDKNDFAIIVELIPDYTDPACNSFVTLEYKEADIEDRDIVNTLRYSDNVIRINPGSEVGVYRCPVIVTLNTW